MTTERVFSVEGMSCGGCEASVRRGLLEMQGVDEVEADHVGRRVRVVLSGDVADIDITARIAELGFRVVA